MSVAEALMGDEDDIILAPRKRRGSPEAAIQRAIVQRMIWHGCKVVAIPNEGKRSVRAGRAMRGTGLAKGAPDLMVLRAGRIGFLEVKAPKGRLSPAQVQMHADMARHGFRVHVVRSQDEAVDALRSEGWAFP